MTEQHSPTSRHRVGLPYAPGWRSPADGLEYGYREGHELRVTLRDLTDREVARIGSEGEVHLALIAQPLVFTLLAGFEGVIPWSGAPYSWHQLRDEERALPPPLVDGETVVLTIVLVEGYDGIVRAVRPVTLSPDFSLALHTAIRAQAGRFFDQGEYERQADRLHQQWRAEEPVDQACARWSSARGGTGR